MSMVDGCVSPIDHGTKGCQAEFAWLSCMGWPCACLMKWKAASWYEWRSIESNSIRWNENVKQNAINWELYQAADTDAQNALNMDADAMMDQAECRSDVVTDPSGKVCWEQDADAEIVVWAIDWEWNPASRCWEKLNRVAPYVKNKNSNKSIETCLKTSRWGWEGFLKYRMLTRAKM